MLSFILYVLPENVQLFTAFTFILSIGLLHGSNDIKIIEQLDVINIANRKLLSAVYILIVLLVLILFFAFPYIILPFFILISAYHFGEQHLNESLYLSQSNPAIKYVLFISYGSYIFFLLFFIEYEMTQSIVADINSFWFSKNTVGLVLAISSSGFIISLFMLPNHRDKRLKVLGMEFLYLGVYLIMFTISSLMVGFALYFVFLHSLPSLKAQQLFLYKNSGFLGFKNYFFDSWKYWLLSIIGLIIFYNFLYDSKEIYSILFAFVAAITFPHVLIMERMMSKK